MIVLALMVQMFVSILQVKGSNFLSGAFVFNNGKLIEYFSL
jgi:hypothetical protein